MVGAVCSQPGGADGFQGHRVVDATCDASQEAVVLVGATLRLSSVGRHDGHVGEGSGPNSPAHVDH